MLYDNALFVRRLTAAWLDTGEDLFRLRIEETIAWLLREMSTEGAFAASLDADSEGGEGSFYVWRPEEVAGGPRRGRRRRVLPHLRHHRMPAISRARRFPIGSSTSTWLGPEREQRLATQRARLLAVRDRRPPPGARRQDPRRLERPRHRRPGRSRRRPRPTRLDRQGRIAVFRFVTESMAADGRLRHSFKDGRFLPSALPATTPPCSRLPSPSTKRPKTRSISTTPPASPTSFDAHYWDERRTGLPHDRRRRRSADRPAPAVVRRFHPQRQRPRRHRPRSAVEPYRRRPITPRRADGDRHGALRGGQRHPRQGGSLQCRRPAPRRHRHRHHRCRPRTSAGRADGAIRGHWRDAFTLLLAADGADIPASHPAAGKTALGRQGRPPMFAAIRAARRRSPTPTHSPNSCRGEARPRSPAPG